ncbi:MAG TPA: MFS transporter [Bryobacteraceae bacterium]|nr:MFS transporter [Bryobacteraceae bacterium]
MNRRYFIVGLIFLGMLISYVDRGNLSIAAASMMRDFRLSPAAMGTLLSAFFWTYAGFQLPAGAIVDRFGIRRTYAAAFLLWSLASAAIAITRGMTDVIAFRMLLGMAEAVGPVASLSFIRQYFAGRDQGTPTAIYIAGQNIGPALGALLGTLLIDRMGWRLMFAATGLVPLLWLPFWLWLVPAHRPQAIEEPRPQPVAGGHLPWGAVLASPAFWAMCLCIFLSSYYWYFTLTWVPTYLTLSRGFSNLEMGRVLSTPLFVMAVMNVAAGFVADRLAKRTGSVFRVRVLFCAAGYACATCILLLLILPHRSAVFPVLLVSMCAIGIGNANYWAISQHAPPPHLTGRTIGFLNTLSTIAGAVAPLATGWLLGPEKNFGVALGVAGISPLLASACLLLAGPKALDRMKSLLAGASVGEAPV